MSKKKIELKGEELERFKALFPTTTNRVVAAAFGHSVPWVTDLASRLGLKKSVEFVRDIGDRRRYGVARRNILMLSGKTLSEIYGEERGRAINAKRTAARNAVIERDRKRIRLGLAPLTSMLAENPIDRAEGNRRWRMRKLGYVTFKKDHTIYYTDETKRVIDAENRCREAGLLVEHISRKR